MAKFCKKKKKKNTPPPQKKKKNNNKKTQPKTTLKSMSERGQNNIYLIV